MTAAEKALQKARIVHAAFLLTTILYVLVPAVAIKTQTKEVEPSTIIAVCVAAFGAVGTGIFFQFQRIVPAAQTLAQNREDAVSAARWQTGVIASLACCETTILLGLLLRFLGASWNICGLFYVAGILLMLAWTPKLNLPPTQ